MKQIMSSPHVHTRHCDGLSTVEEMIVAALGQGFESIGFSGHARQDFDTGYCMSEASELEYIRDVSALRTKYNSRIKIWLGIERDKWSFSGREPYEYVIGSVHYLKDGNDFAPVDGDPEAMHEYCERTFSGNGLLLAREYYKEFTSYVCSYHPDIIGHLDVIRKNNTDSRYFDSFDPEYRKIVMDALEVMVSACRVMEVNTGGMARNGFDTPYPELFALKRWHALGGEVVLSSDCHKACDIAFGYEKGLSAMREVGFDHALALGRGNALFEEYPL